MLSGERLTSPHAFVQSIVASRSVWPQGDKNPPPMLVSKEIQASKVSKEHKEIKREAMVVERTVKGRIFIFRV